MQLEAETAMMEKRLEMFKNLMRDVNPYKALNEREFAKKISTVTETADVKPQQPLPKTQFKLKPSKQTTAIKPKSANGLEFLKSYNEQNDDLGEGIELTFKTQAKKNVDLFDQVFEIRHLRSLKGRLIEAGINDLEALKSVSIETFNQLFITAHKQDKIRAAIESVVPYKKSEEPVTQGTQAEFLGPDELPTIDTRKMIYEETNGIKDRFGFKKINQIWTKIETNLQTEEQTQGNPRIENKASPNAVSFSLWYESDSFLFSSIIPSMQSPVEEKHKEKLSTKLAVCYHCFALFPPELLHIDPNSQIVFCSKKCQIQNKKDKETRQPVETLDPIVGESNGQINATESSDEDLKDIDLDFSFDV